MSVCVFSEAIFGARMELEILNLDSDGNSSAITSGMFTLFFEMLF